MGVIDRPIITPETTHTYIKPKPLDPLGRALRGREGGATLALAPIGTLTGLVKPSVAYESLSPKRRAFVDHYVQTKNATEAARLAGYQHPTKQGSRLLIFVDVAAAIKERQRLIDTKRLKKIHDYYTQLEEIAFGEEKGPTQVAALKELLRLRDNNHPREKEKSEERKARIAYLKAKTAELIGGTQEEGDVEIVWEDAKE